MGNAAQESGARVRAFGKGSSRKDSGRQQRRVASSLERRIFASLTQRAELGFRVLYVFLHLWVKTGSKVAQINNLPR